MHRSLGFLLAMIVSLLFTLSGALAESTGNSTSAEDVKRELGELFDTINAYTFEQKEAYQQAIRAKLREFDTQIEALQARAENARQETRAQLEAQLDMLQRKREALRTRLQQFRTASAKSWSDIKAGVHAATDELLNAYEEAMSHFD